MKPSLSATGVRQRSIARRLITSRNVVWAVIIGVVIAAAFSTTVIHTDDDPGQVTFDAEAYADENFESIIMPEIIARAVDLATVIEAIEEDEEQAKLEYGNSSNPYNPYSYAVTFTAIAGEATGRTVELTVDGMPPGYTVRLQIVPGTGTALRDVTGFVDLNQFLNQVEYLNASLEFNYKAEELVLIPFLSDHPASSLEGKTLQITGAFTDNTPNLITVIPVVLTVVDETVDDQ